MKKHNSGRALAPLVALSLLFPFLSPAPVAIADEFELEPGPPTISPITLTENTDDIFRTIQPAASKSTDRYNVKTTVGLPGGHDDLEKLEMCWYLEDFDDCYDDQKIADFPEIVFKATYQVERVGGKGSEITGESFRVIGDNNYDVSESSTNVTEVGESSVFVDVAFSFYASNAMRASSNWKVYMEVEDKEAKTAATSREGIRVEYFAEMTTDRQDVGFGGVAKGAQQIEQIDTGNYTANAQSQFFIEASDFNNEETDTTIELVRTETAALVNQVELRCDRDENYDQSNSRLVKAVATKFGSSIDPSSEDPVDAPNHSCAVSFPKGGAVNPNLLYSNTFILSIAASELTAPEILSISETKNTATIQFSPPQIVTDDNASLDGYRVEIIDADSGTTREATRIAIRELQEGAWGYDNQDEDGNLSVTVDGLSPDTEYRFLVEASTSVGTGSDIENSTTLLDLTVTLGNSTVAGWAGNPIQATDEPTLGENFGEHVTWSVTEGALPSGLSLDSSTGVVSGTPSEDGSFSALITATDEDERQGSERLSFTIQPEPTIDPTSLSISGTINESITVSAPSLEGFEGPFTWEVTRGSLPNGLNLDDRTGVISGTPSESGATNISVTLTDSNDNTATLSIAFSISPEEEYEFVSATFTPGGKKGREGPTLQQIRDGISDTGGTDSWVDKPEYLDSINGIVKWIVPQTGTYRIKAAGAGSTVKGGVDGQGAVLEGWFELTQGQTLFLLVGQTSTPISRSWSGGGGGSFVAFDQNESNGITVADSRPLLVAGGGGATRSETNFDSRVRGNTATWGKDGTGLKSAGVDGKAANYVITGRHFAGGFGSAAGFYGEGPKSGDNRFGGDNIAPRSFINGGLGGQFEAPSYINGGFGGGGNGSWGGAGGGGGYSGGGDDDNQVNGSSAGGGGSFVADEASNVKTSTGSFSSTGDEPDEAYTGLVGYLGEWQDGNGYIEIELLG